MLLPTVENAEKDAGCVKVMDGVAVVKFGQTISCFLGVFNLEKLKKMTVFKNQTCLIIITNSHAIAVRFENSFVELFDPLGISNNKTLHPIFLFLKRHLPCKKLILNTKIQADKSSQCAKFCLVFLYLRSHNYTFNDFLNLFTDNFTKNDSLICSLFRKCFNKSIRSKSADKVNT